MTVSCKDLLWKTCYRQWKPRSQTRTPGYTVFLPLPGDLPVFLKIALHVLSCQDLKHLVEVVVVPDMATPSFRQQWQRLSILPFPRPLRLVRLSPLDRFVVFLFENPGHIHFLQNVRALDACHTTHALIHDADLLITDPNFLKSHYESCLTNHLFCHGASSVWDPWYQTRGLSHLVATWEMMFDVEWFRSFLPYQHRPHSNIIKGERHVFDLTLFPQCLSPKERFAVHHNDKGFIHFNYVISTYRWFLKAKTAFRDEYFRLLLIRLLMTIFDMDDPVSAVPTLSTLQKGLTTSSAPVIYDTLMKGNYLEFRERLRALTASLLLNHQQQDRLIQGLRSFDAFYC